MAHPYRSPLFSKPCDCQRCTEIAEVESLRTELTQLRAAVDTLVKQRGERVALANAISADNSHLAGVRHALTVFAKAFEMGGVSCGKLCEMLGHGISDLHSAGVQEVANAIVDAADDRAAVEGLRPLVERYRRSVLTNHVGLRESGAMRLADACLALFPEE